jgi:hypothetical protein
MAVGPTITRLPCDRRPIEAAAEKIDEAEPRDRGRIDAVVDADLGRAHRQGRLGGARIAEQPHRHARQRDIARWCSTTEPAHEAIGVGPELDRRRAGVIAKQRQRRLLEALDAMVGGLSQTLEYGQADPVGTGQRERFGQNLILARFGRRAEVDIIGDARGACANQPLDRVSMMAASPRPASQGPQADRIDRDDQKLVRRGPSLRPVRRSSSWRSIASNQPAR